MISKKHVVGDSSFYIAFLSSDEINNPKVLLEIIQKYRFILGEVILKEILKQHNSVLKKINFKKYIKILKKYDYSSLLSIIGDKIFKKGEYEGIAIAYFIYQKEMLHSLILDDNPAQRWVMKNIPILGTFVKYSLRFLVDCCFEDILSREQVVYILNKVENSIKLGKRPFNLTINKIYIVRQLLNEVKKCQN